MIIQEKLASRLYELLPHKKELEFGCEAKNKENNILAKVISNSVAGVAIQNIGTANVVYHHNFVEYYEIIGQPLRLADLLLAIDIKYNHQQEPEIYEFICSKYDREGGDKEVFYNLQDDNILNQSNELCEWALELLK